MLIYLQHKQYKQQHIVCWRKTNVVEKNFASKTIYNLQQMVHNIKMNSEDITKAINSLVPTNQDLHPTRLVHLPVSTFGPTPAILLHAE